MRPDFFDCLPRPTALLLLAGVLDLATAHALHQLPRQTPAPTITIPHHALHVVSWPLRPTPPPMDLLALRRRQENTVCGFIGGNSALPATCGSGSHCVLDTEHNVVGCCPNGAPSCTAGVFTGCVDANSGPQTEVNPYVFSCTGSNVCYKNVFDGGFSQFGCGTASNLATTVLNSASGLTAALTQSTLSVSFTQSVSTLSEPTTLGTISTKSTSSSHSSSASPSSSASTTAANPVATSSSGASAATDSSYRTGAIVGGTIGGLAMLIALIGLAYFFIRRRRANLRQGPGPGGIRGKVISPPRPGGGTGFTALTQDTDAFETGPAAGSVLFNNQPQPQMSSAAAATSTADHHRSLLPPIATGPPMPFQSDVSPVADEPDTALTAPTTAGLAISSVSSYPPSSSGGASASAAAVSAPSADGSAAATNTAAQQLQQQQQQQYHYPGQYPAAYAGGAALMMGMNPLLARGGERTLLASQIHHQPPPPPLSQQQQHQNLESDEIPLTSASSREIDDFSQGFHAALGRIGEEDEDEMMEEYRDHHEHDQHDWAHQQQQQPGEGVSGLVQGQSGTGGGDGAEGTHDSTGSGGSGPKPLWQQNRRQSRNLMWM